MIKDADDEFKANVVGQDQEDPMQDMWQEKATLGSWAGAEVLEAASPSGQ